MKFSAHFQWHILLLLLTTNVRNLARNWRKKGSSRLTIHFFLTTRYQFDIKPPTRSFSWISRTHPRVLYSPHAPVPQLTTVGSHDCIKWSDVMGCRKVVHGLLWWYYNDAPSSMLELSWPQPPVAVKMIPLCNFDDTATSSNDPTKQFWCSFQLKSW